MFASLRLKSKFAKPLKIVKIQQSDGVWPIGSRRMPGLFAAEIGGDFAPALGVPLEEGIDNAV